MIFLWALLIGLSPVILYSVALLFFAIQRRRCPRCGRHGLRYVGSYLWDGRDDQGRRTGGAVSFHQCQYCSARLRQLKRGEWSDATDEEWKKHVKRPA